MTLPVKYAIHVETDSYCGDQQRRLVRRCHDMVNGQSISQILEYLPYL